MQSAAIDIATSGVTSGVSMDPSFVLVLLGAWKLRTGVHRQLQTVAHSHRLKRCGQSLPLGDQRMLVKSSTESHGSKDLGLRDNVRQTK